MQATKQSVPAHVSQTVPTFLRGPLHPACRHQSASPACSARKRVRERLVLASTAKRKFLEMDQGGSFPLSIQQTAPLLRAPARFAAVFRAFCRVPRANGAGLNGGSTT